MAHQIEINTATLQSVLEQVNALPEVISLPILNDPASASDALAGKEFIDGDGNKVKGTIITVGSNSLGTIDNAVIIPAGYYPSQVTKTVPSAIQATPSISIDSSGKITATSTQTAGYVKDGTKISTKQLTTQTAKTVTPTKSSQTAVAKNVYTTGIVTVAAIPDQYQDITTPLAELNAANGGTSASTINAAVDNTEAHASSQEALIAQIVEALEGKAAESSEDVSAETAEYTEQLDELESVIDSLPDAGGGNAVETCTVTVTCVAKNNPVIPTLQTFICSKYENGVEEVSKEIDLNHTSYTIENVKTQSLVIIGSSLETTAMYAEKAQEVYSLATRLRTYYITAPAGDTVAIKIEA